jgi:hypothetical protein
LSRPSRFILSPMDCTLHPPSRGAKHLCWLRSDEACHHHGGIRRRKSDEIARIRDVDTCP